MEPRFHEAFEQFRTSRDECQLFQKIAAFARQIGFEYCCYGLRLPVPVSKPAVSIFDTYPRGWMAHYQASGFEHRPDSQRRNASNGTDRLARSRA
jgi:LuxR family quorum-sensing system transcriptional regulator SolR